MDYYTTDRTTDVNGMRQAAAMGTLILVLTSTPTAQGQTQSHTDAGQNTFDRTVAPILSAHCLSCHSGEEPTGGLDLRRRESAMRGGDSGTVIKAGEVDESYLWELIETDEMPPEGALSDQEKQIVRQWIADGAKWGTDPIDPFAFSSPRRAGYDWWSLQPLKKPSVPKVNVAQWAVNEIDQFVLATLHDNGLQPSPRAGARQLVRRLYVDLIGLPAPAEVIDRFAADTSQTAWTQLVDDLLASKHYGERWARHWMDIARFGESHGFEYNQPRENFWHYRDWLIRAFNSDMAYDQFAAMQLAGDILEPNTPGGAAAVGFLVAGTHNTVLGASPTMKLAVRHDELEELAGTVGQTFLGMTINCARCHDHKFDPITTREYYSFIAALDGVQHGERSFPSLSSFSKQLMRIVSKQDELEEQLAQQIQARGGVASHTANLVVAKDAITANAKGRKYRVTYRVAASVWAAPIQATSNRDGVSISIAKTDGSTLAQHSAHPGEWRLGADASGYQLQSFDYLGDGDGGVRIHLRPFPLNSGRFGGAIDDITVSDVLSKETVFSENFDNLQRPNAPGTQAHTNRPVYFGATSKRWTHSGTNTLHAVEHVDGNLALQLFSGNGGIEAFEAQTPSEQQLRSRLASLEGECSNIPKPSVYTVIAGKPGAMQIYRRGDVSAPDEDVVPGGLVAIKNLSASFEIEKTAADSRRRVQLANWITHRENSLFHRVIVNRIWHFHFGKGLVTSPSDFGFNGSRPSHPGLLDWLSLWFRDNGYSLKKLHRLIATSATFQQTSHPRPDAEKVDKGNRFLWRQNARRIEAEVLRDSILDISGQLNRKQFGPGYRDVEIVKVPPAFYYSPLDPVGTQFNRRTIYRWNVRGQRSALLDTFDCPDPSTKTPTRMVTTTPSQALSQWNDSFVTRMSEHLADRIKAESGDDVTEQVSTAWRRVLGRFPIPEESSNAVRLVSDHGLPLLCRVLFNCNEFVLID